MYFYFFFFQAEDGIRDYKVTGVQTCALPISARLLHVGAIRLGGGTHVPRLPQRPALGLHQLAVLVVVLSEADRQLERDGRAGRQVEILEKGDPLFVAEGGSVVLEGPAPPMSHRGVPAGPAGRQRGPLRQEDGRGRVQPSTAAVGERRAR